MDLLTEIVADKGLSQVARACCVTYQAVRKWERGGLPRTDFTGETNYAGILAALSVSDAAAQAILRHRLLEETRTHLIGRRELKAA